MMQITAKELTFISDALTQEALLCKKARAYSRSLTDSALAQCMSTVADEHETRYNALLQMIGG